ncbi:type II toxin-antitoxin system VapC family toxin [Siccirubricoccus sp. KC 17139]|uniref:Ribonuclease VapC n=1 Tax=Siccirubricoccus soli TaxID=2899147 RepID=A0ABT1DBA2_9PROT|nr:type II toxin-antitoxin system VapC family toxin [Siccirubricoccus soli]MCP2684380.1 type II toxin-antitoxin system VapC family toxin [Siccirubricoccus soli]
MSLGVLLDTCAVIWLANGDRLAPAALEAILAAGAGDGIFVSPVTAWEVGMLARPRPNRPAIDFLPDPQTWFARLMAAPGIRPAPLTPGIAIGASFLPGEPHGDPGDRLIIATARDRGLPLVTRDRAILAYGAAGHVRVVAC